MTNYKSLTRVIFWFLLALVLGAAALVMDGQEPTQPKPTIDRTEWALLASAATARGLDVYTTREGLGSQHMREKCLPNVIAGNTPGMMLYSGGIVVLDYLVARELSKHHHRKLAYILTAIDAGTTLPFAIHNETLLQK